MTGFVRRLAMASGGLFIAAVLAGCGGVGGNGGGNNGAPPATPAPAATTATGSAAATKAACTDVATIKQSVADLKTDLSNRDLTAAKTSWSKLTAAVSDLGTNARNTGSAAAQQIHDTLAPITANFSSLDSMAKLTAVVAALNVAAPALNSALTTVKTNLHCPD